MAKKLLNTLGFKAEELIREDGYRPTISVSMDLRSDVDLNGTRIIAQFWDGDPELSGTSTIIVQPEMVSPYSFEELRPAEYKSNGVDITGPGNLLYTNSGEAIPGRGDLTDIVGDYTWHRLTLEGIEIPRFSGGNPAVYIEIFYAFVSKASGGSDINVRRWMLNRGNKCAPYNPSNSLTGSATNITEYYVIPEQFGAAGNGTTDDTAAVQAALNTGREVRLPRGKVYGISSELSVGVAGTRITGYGGFRVLAEFNDELTSYDTSVNTTVLRVTADRCLFKSFFINFDNYPATGIILESDKNQAEELRFFNWGNQSPYHTVISESPYGSPYSPGEPNYQTSSESAIILQGDENFVRHCYFQDFQNTVPGSVPRCITVQSGAQGSIISDCQGVNIHAGIVVGMSNRTTVSNCVFDTTADNGIYLVRGSHNVYLNNIRISNSEEPVVIVGYNIYIDGLYLHNIGQSETGAGSIGIEKCNNIYVKNYRQTYDTFANDAVPFVRTRSGNKKDPAKDWDLYTIVHYEADSSGRNEFSYLNTNNTASYVNSSTFKITNIDASVYFWPGREINIKQTTWDGTGGTVISCHYDGTDSYITTDITVANANIDGIAAIGSGTVVFEECNVDSVWGRNNAIFGSSPGDLVNNPLIVHNQGIVDTWVWKNCTITGIVNDFSFNPDDLTVPGNDLSYYFFNTDGGTVNSFQVYDCVFKVKNFSNWDFDNDSVVGTVFFRLVFPTVTKYSFWVDSYMDVSEAIGRNIPSLGDDIEGRITNLGQDLVFIKDNFSRYNTASGYLRDITVSSSARKIAHSADATTDVGNNVGDIIEHNDASVGEPSRFYFDGTNWQSVGPVGGVVTGSGSGLSGTGFSSDPLIADISAIANEVFSTVGTITAQWTFSVGPVVNNDIYYKGKNTSNANIGILTLNSSDQVVVGAQAYPARIHGSSLTFYDGSNNTVYHAGNIGSLGVPLDNNVAVSGKESGGTVRNLIKMESTDDVRVGATTNDLWLYGASLIFNDGSNKTVYHTGNIGSLGVELNNNVAVSGKESGGTVRNLIKMESTNDIRVGATTNDLWLYGASLIFNDGSNKTVWHSGNDGIGSTLNADLLDDQHGGYYTNASNLDAGTVPIARLGSSGTPSSSTYLRGDNTWATPPGGDNDYVDSVTFNTGTGVLTLGRTSPLGDLTEDLDGRYGILDSAQTVSGIWRFSAGPYLDNSTALKGRNVANSANLELIQLDSADAVKVGNTGSLLRLFGNSATGIKYYDTAYRDVYTTGNISTLGISASDINSGTLPIARLDLNLLTTSTANGDGDYFVVVDTVGAQKKLTKANINLSGFNNDSGWTSNTGDITAVNITAGVGLTGSQNTASGTHTQTLSIDIPGTTDIGAALSGADEFLVSDAGTLRRSDISRMLTYIQANATAFSNAITFNNGITSTAASNLFGVTTIGSLTVNNSTVLGNGAGDTLSIFAATSATAGAIVEYMTVTFRGTERKIAIYAV